MASKQQQVRMAAFAVMVVMFMAAAAMVAEAVVNCKQVDNDLAQCLAYLQNQGGNSPAPACCTGVKALAAATQTTVDRRAACNCLKAAAARAGKIDNVKVGSLASQCGINLSFRPSLSQNCNAIP